ncbi:MAG TPA: FecR domain-containing protein [Spirochaetota bacterium]|nr:FecR domain-containing protein [Spirochaetota bacterium]HPJ33676.1 FecR domain-containing protein [Spirochaetota bacterium]
MKKKFLTMIFTLIVAIIAGCGRGDIEEHATLSFMIGDVKINSVEAQIGDILKQNDDIVTGNNSFCDIRIGDSLIRIKAKSKVKISTLIKSGNIENTEIGLNTGKMLCKPKKLLKDEKFLVKTPTAVAGVRGTQFAVEADKLKTTRIKVFQGEVKVARRIKHFEASVDKVMKLAPTLEKQEKVVITADEVKNAEKVVENRIKNATSGKLPSDEVIEKVIQKSEVQIGIADKNIEKFQPADFALENKEIIEVAEKPKEDIVRIKKIIKQEKKKPVPSGRLLITRYDIYYIKDGKILWDGKVVNEAVKANGKIYIASGEYVFCADSEGTIIWKANVQNNGSLLVEGGKVTVKSGEKDVNLNANSGKKM